MLLLKIYIKKIINAKNKVYIYIIVKKFKKTLTITLAILQSYTFVKT